MAEGGGTAERHGARLREAARQRGTGRGCRRNGKQGDEHFHTLPVKVIGGISTHGGNTGR